MSLLVAVPSFYSAEANFTMADTRDVLPELRFRSGKAKAGGGRGGEEVSVPGTSDTLSIPLSPRWYAVNYSDATHVAPYKRLHLHIG